MPRDIDLAALRGRHPEHFPRFGQQGRSTLLVGGAASSAASWSRAAFAWPRSSG